MGVRIGVNGFGRIGRYLARLLAAEEGLDMVVVNARSSKEDLAHLLKYDSVHGIFEDVEVTAQGIAFGKQNVAVTSCKAGEWEWGKFDCDLVIETTGSFRDRKSCESMLQCGAGKVIVSAPAKDPDATVVMGVNDEVLSPDMKIISSASCTTNCLAPVAKIINDTWGIRHGTMTTVHSYTMSQRVLDGSHKDIRRARACAMSMIPTSTGAAKAVGLVLPELAGKLHGMAVRVPTPNVSLVDLVCELENPCTPEAINAALKNAANEHMGYTDTPLVSVDFTGSTHGGVVDGLLTNVMGDTQLKLIIWYDNEAGFSNQLLRLIKKVAAL